jgi:hypothetical protein
MKWRYWYLSMFIGVAVLSCKPDKGVEDNNSPSTGIIKINYGDSILYLKPSNGDYIVTPAAISKPGKYYAFPDGLEIDPITGAINLSKSETGMRYKIIFVADGTTDTVSAKIVLSGINYKDYYHVQTANDTLSRPFYNANFANFNMPCTGTGCAFDTDGTARAKGLAINPLTGVINLKKTIQNGFFGSGNPQDGDVKEVDIKYKLNDLSNSAVNTIKVKLYFYYNSSTVSANLSDLLIERINLFLQIDQSSFPTVTGRNILAAKPRPPCLVILGS